MRGLSIIAMLGLVLGGCDSVALRTNLESRLCSFLPPEVDCMDADVQAKALSVLDHGVTYAHAECSTPDIYWTRRNPPATPFPVPPGYTLDQIFPPTQHRGVVSIRVSWLQDDAAFIDNVFTPRGLVPADFRTVYGGMTLSLVGGELVAEITDQGSNPFYEFVTTGYPVDEVCTGFNLEAFGG